MARGTVRRRLMANRHVRSVAANLAMKVGIAALMHGFDRMLPDKPAKAKPAKRVRAVKAAAPLAVLAGAGALGRLIYTRSEVRRKRRAGLIR